MLRRYELPGFVRAFGAKGAVIFADSLSNYRDFLDYDDQWGNAHWLYQHNNNVFLPPWGKCEQWTMSVQHTMDDVDRFVANLDLFARELRASVPADGHPPSSVRHRAPSAHRRDGPPSVRRRRAVTTALLQLNIEYGGTGVSFDAVVDTIKASGAPVVALQEGCTQVPAIAAALGWPYFDNRTQVVSQLPLLDPPGASAGVIYLEVEPGRVVAIVNVHPASRGYGATRLPKVSRSAGCCDANGTCASASCNRRWTRPRRLMLPVCPSSCSATSTLRRTWTGPRHRRVAAARHHTGGLADQPRGGGDRTHRRYRSVHPDPVADPGLTWPAERPFVEGYNPAADGHPADRIDFLHVSPDVAVDDVQIVGEVESPYSEVIFTPWPTDHRGLLASLRVSPAPPPPVVSVSPRLVCVGDAVVVRVIADDVNMLRVVACDGASADPAAELSVDASGVATLDTAALGPGEFAVVAVDARERELATASLWVAPEGSAPQIATDRAAYSYRDAVTAKWSLGARQPR